MFRVGLGRDSHRFSGDVNKKLVLAGVEFEEVGFEANSDGDLVLHALCDAIEQALGGNSFANYADRLCKEGIQDSREYLKIALENMKKQGYQLNNVGITMEGVRPKIMPMAEKIRRSLVGLLSLSGGSIGINATTGEGLSAIGRGEGLEVLVIVSLFKNNEKN